VQEYDIKTNTETTTCPFTRTDWCKANSQPLAQTWPPVWEVDAQLHNLVQRLDLELDGKLMHERQRHLACRDVRLDGFVRRQNVAAVPARVILFDDKTSTSGANKLTMASFIGTRSSLA
jgi:hypothetical protein